MVTLEQYKCNIHNITEKFTKSRFLHIPRFCSLSGELSNGKQIFFLLFFKHFIAHGMAYIAAMVSCPLLLLLIRITAPKSISNHVTSLLNIRLSNSIAFTLLANRRAPFNTKKYHGPPHHSKAAVLAKFRRGSKQCTQPCRNQRREMPVSVCGCAGVYISIPLAFSVFLNDFQILK